MRLWRDRRQQAIEQLIAALRAQYEPEVHPELTDAISLDAKEPGLAPPRARQQP
jgi:hypothetical protein